MHSSLSLLFDSVPRWSSSSRATSVMSSLFQFVTCRGCHDDGTLSRRLATGSYRLPLRWIGRWLTVLSLLHRPPTEAGLTGSRCPLCLTVCVGLGDRQSDLWRSPTDRFADRQISKCRSAGRSLHRSVWRTYAADLTGRFAERKDFEPIRKPSKIDEGWFRPIVTPIVRMRVVT